MRLFMSIDTSFIPFAFTVSSCCLLSFSPLWVCGGVFCLSKFKQFQVQASLTRPKDHSIFSIVCLFFHFDLHFLPNLVTNNMPSFFSETIKAVKRGTNQRRPCLLQCLLNDSNFSLRHEVIVTVVYKMNITAISCCPKHFCTIIHSISELCIHNVTNFVTCSLCWLLRDIRLLASLILQINLICIRHLNKN